MYSSITENFNLKINRRVSEENLIRFGGMRKTAESQVCINYNFLCPYIGSGMIVGYIVNIFPGISRNFLVTPGVSLYPQPPTQTPYPYPPHPLPVTSNQFSPFYISAQIRRFFPHPFIYVNVLGSHTFEFYNRFRNGALKSF